MTDPSDCILKKREMKSKNAEPIPIKKIKESDADSSLHNYQDDSDFDEAFKNLLRPVEQITKKNNCEPLQYDLLKELDSYLNHLRETSNGGSPVFVEAALMIQNVILIYQKRVDQYVDVMMSLIGKFRSYRINQNNENDENENMEGNTKKHKEKKVKFYPTFDLIPVQFEEPQNYFDCRSVNLTKKLNIPRIVLNANIKVENKYNKIMPYIYVGNGETIGKKYDFLLSYPLNCDLAVNEEFDCPTNKESATTIKYRECNDPLPTNVMEVDDVGVSDDIYPDSPNQDIFNQMVNDEVCVANAMLPNPVNILNVSQIPSKDDLNNVWSEANHTSDKTKDTVIEKPIGKAKFKSKKEDNTAIWLPTYTVGELRCELMILKMGLPVNSAFRQKIHLIQSLQKSEAAKMKLKQIIEADKKKFDYHDEEMEMKLKNGDELGFRGFNSPTSYDGFDENVAMDIIDEQIEEANQGDFLSYQDIQNDMERYKQNQQDIINEQGLMLKRVQQWHENLRPILEEEEKRTEFDIHEYGTRLLNCFKSIGEQKTFKELIELVGGSAQVEVSRYFLSTLMMTNTYNLKLTKSSDGEMIIELLKKERHHEELQVNIGNQVNQEPK